MTKTARLLIEEKAYPNEPILVVDKKGTIGEALVYELSQKSLVVLVSKKDLDVSSKKLENVVVIPYSDKLPVIPDNTYSHIFFIDDRESSSRKFIPEFVKKASKDRAGFIFLISLFDVDGRLTAGIVDAYQKAKVIVYGDVFGKNTVSEGLSSSGVINKFVYQAIKFHRIEVSGDGLNKTYPVFLEDLILGILLAVFGNESSFNVFYLFPKHPPTELSLAHAFHKVNPEISIDFIKTNKKEKEIVVEGAGKYLLDEEYKVWEKLKKIDLDSIDVLSEKNKDEEIDFDKKSKGFFRWLILLFLIFVVFPILVPTFFYLGGLKLFQYGQASFEKGEIDNNSKKSIILARSFFDLAKKSSIPLLAEARFIGREKKVELFIKDISTKEEISSGFGSLAEAVNIYSLIFKGESRSPKNDFVKAGNFLTSSLISASRLKTDKASYGFYNKKLESLYSLANVILSNQDLLPSIFGAREKKTYLILFQDNAELRPTGGLISVYGLLSLESGRITGFSIHDVGEADSQLKGHVEPPYPVRRYLASSHWYLKDSNFNMDFVKSASSAANFLNLEIGKKADGVIAIDKGFIKKIISAIGPEIDLSSPNKIVLEKSFLMNLFDEINKKLSLGKSFPYFSLARAIEESIKEKQILFAFNQKQLQDVFTIHNWSGSLLDNRGERLNTINDFLSINEANLGANKVNNFVERKLEHLMVINNNGSATGSAAVFYKNKSLQQEEGVYKNYLRFTLPLGSNLSSVLIDGILQKQVLAITDPLVYEGKRFTPPAGIEIEEKEENGKTTYGFLITIPAGEEKNVVINYDLPMKISLEKSDFYYDLLIAKQPGVGVYPYSFSLSYPDGFKLIRNSKGVVRGEGKIYYSTYLKEDLSINGGFAKK